MRGFTFFTARQVRITWGDQMRYVWGRGEVHAEF